MKTCTIDGCNKPHRARGLCVTHYNHQYQPGRHATAPTACVICGAIVMRQPRSDRRPTCSIACRTALEHGDTAIGGGYDWATAAMRRARLAGAHTIHHIERADVFERDGWTCYLCHRPLDPAADPYDPSSPTIDHVVPLSRGGQHVLDNVRTACLGCNSAKQEHPHAA